MEVSVISYCIIVEGEKGVSKLVYLSQALFQREGLCPDLLRILLLAVGIFCYCF